MILSLDFIFYQIWLIIKVFKSSFLDSWNEVSAPVASRDKVEDVVLRNTWKNQDNDNSIIKSHITDT